MSMEVVDIRRIPFWFCWLYFPQNYRQAAGCGFAFAERGDGNGEDVQPVVKIFTEQAVKNKGFKAAVGGGNDADIDLDGFGAAYSLKLFS